MDDDRLRETLPQFVQRYSDVCDVADELPVPCSCEDGGGPWHWAMVKPNRVNEHFDHEDVLMCLRQSGSDNWIGLQEKYMEIIAFGKNTTLRAVFRVEKLLNQIISRQACDSERMLNG